MTAARLSADLIEAFAGMYLSPRYDQPAPTPPFHRKAWALYASNVLQAMVIAPREHAKSTGLTFVYIMALVCFREGDYVVLVGSTEENASEQLSNIREELLENEDLRRDFGIHSFEKDSSQDIIVRCNDGHRFRVLARGAEQRIRGKLWKGKRPTHLVCDDMEDDEQVMNPDRRLKFRRWFFRAAKQALGKGGKARVHGTILHEDSLLSRLRRNSMWQHLYYKAHAAFDDFTNILWPEQWSEKRLRDRRQEFIDDGDSAGYSQEFLNDPQDDGEAYLRAGDFLAMNDADHSAPKILAVGCDFAVSKSDMANRTSFTVGGPDERNIVHHVDFYVGRWSSTVTPGERAQGERGWIDVMFDIQERHNPDIFFVEGGVIWKAVSRTVQNEMLKRGRFLNIEVLEPVNDKATRGRAFQARHRAGATRWNTSSDGFEGAKQEMLRFTGLAAARLDDQFDSCATLHLGVEKLSVLDKEDFLTEDEVEFERSDPRRYAGRSAVTGY